MVIVMASIRVVNPEACHLKQLQWEVWEDPIMAFPMNPLPANNNNTIQTPTITMRAQQSITVQARVVTT